MIDFFGPTDLALYAKSEGIEDGYLVPVFGKACKTDPTVFKKASPMTYVRKDAPPILILHGTLDLIVPIKHSEMLYKALTDVGATVEMHTVSFAGHGGWNDRDMQKAQDAVFHFLDTPFERTEVNVAVRCREPKRERSETRRGPWVFLSSLSGLLAVVALAVPLLAHGCHAGDHDDEPVFAPHKHDAERSR